ncbi:MAG: alpha-L-rhamnosidase, partial [Opitutaceae bacterium]|nr:alpha-L-rhamnosidase [Opitutaceae bacterium]
SLDAYVDTPWREQAQWWGDARVQSWNTFHLSGDARLLRRGIAQIAGQTTQEGLTYGHAPTIAHSCVLPDFTLIWFLTLWDYSWQTGSTGAFETHHDAVLGALAYFKKNSDPKTGLVSHDDRFWLFLDWTDLHKDGVPAVYNLWLLIALERLAQLAARTKRAAESAALAKWAQKLRKSLARLATPDGLMRDGWTAGGEIVGDTSLHAQVLGLEAGVPGLKKAAALEKLLLPYIREDKCETAPPSAYWVTYILSFLSGGGHGKDVVDFIKRRWLPMAGHGTTWENFAPRRADESFSHAWSAHPLFHLMQIMGGVRQDAPAWRKITYSPVFHGDRCDTVIPTPLGLIKSKWRKVKNKVHIELALPQGMSARATLPGLVNKTIKGRWRAQVLL